jgi:hypothetical protein
MPDEARELIRNFNSDQRLVTFATRLRAWLFSQMAANPNQPADYPESRAHALMHAAGAIDDVTLADFKRLVAERNGLRVALYDLLQASGLAGEEEVVALGAVTSRAQIEGEPQQGIEWLSLTLAGHAWKRGYPLAHLDPASPPEKYSPAGQVVANAAAFVRGQIQRNATERDRLARTLAPREPGSARLDDLQPEGAIAPLPPHFRPPIPVRYPEVANETLQVETDGVQVEQPVTRGDALVITESDLGGEQGDQPPETSSGPVRMPPLRISPEQVQSTQPPSPLPPTAVIMPSNTSESRSGLTVALRQIFGSESLTTTKLRVVAHAHPDGPGLYGLQVKISCKGVRSFVAGTTDRNGRFVAELPVKLQEGLTYDVDVTWPREMGGEVERKSITLHADRTEFALPFHRSLTPRDQGHGTETD